MPSRCLEKEELPLKIDAALIKKRYPAAFINPPVKNETKSASETKPDQSEAV
ncbi:MAG TPA: hypothetical protein VFU89_02545 [Rhabdochlamydiaceae bacterium]|nr:hypothetical protein [Rhabdochlamydiaceae bacterium]